MDFGGTEKERDGVFSQQWLRWHEGLENAEEVSVKDLPDEGQYGLKCVGREIR